MRSVLQIRIPVWIAVSVSAIVLASSSAYAVGKAEVEIILEQIKSKNEELARSEERITERNKWVEEADKTDPLNWSPDLIAEMKKNGNDVMSGRCDEEACGPAHCDIVALFKEGESHSERYEDGKKRGLLACQVVFEVLGKSFFVARNTPTGRECERALRGCPLVSKEDVVAVAKRSVEVEEKTKQKLQAEIAQLQRKYSDLMANCDDCKPKQDWIMTPNGPVSNREPSLLEKLALGFRVLTPAIQSVAGVVQYGMAINSFNNNYDKYLADCKMVGMAPCEYPPIFGYGGGWGGWGGGGGGWGAGGPWGGGGGLSFNAGFGGAPGFFNGGSPGFGSSPNFGTPLWGGNTFPGIAAVPPGFNPWWGGGGPGGVGGLGGPGGWGGGGGIQFGLGGGGAMPGLGGNGWDPTAGFAGFGNFGGGGGAGGAWPPYSLPYGAYGSGPFMNGFPGAGWNGGGGGLAFNGGNPFFPGAGGVTGGAGYFDPSAGMHSAYYAAQAQAQIAAAQQAQQRAQQSAQSIAAANQQWLEAQQRLLAAYQNARQGAYTSGLY